MSIIRDDETRDYIRELGGMADDYEQELADVAVQLADVYLTETDGGRRYYYDEDGVRHPSKVLWDEISDLSNRWKPDTVRTQERYARLIPKHVRSEYDMFTWSHFKTIFDACGSDLECLKKELDYWIEKAHEYSGNIAPVRVVYSHYQTYDKPAWETAADKLLSAAEALLETDAPPEYQRIAGIVVDMWPTV